MIEFKQIIGRGTRLFDGKDYFTIYDFVKAYEHFNDPDWDGEPAEPPEPIVREGQLSEIGDQPVQEAAAREEPEEYAAKRKIKIKLADGKERTLQHMMATSFWSPDGTPMSAAQFVERLFGDLPELFKNEDELRAIWSQPDTRKKLLQGLAEKGYANEQLKEVSRMINAENSDLYDVLAYIAFALAPISRQERVDTHQDNIYSSHGDHQREFLEFVLQQYVKEGVQELDDDKLPDLLELKYQTINDAVKRLGSTKDIRKVFVGFQRHLYSSDVE
jgi:type I restriction enzyme R subunit